MSLNPRGGGQSWSSPFVPEGRVGAGYTDGRHNREMEPLMPLHLVAKVRIPLPPYLRSLTTKRQINKPELPVASGALDKSLAWVLVLVSVIAGPYIVQRAFSPIIFRLYITGLVTGTVYSIPPFHFKRYPIIAGLIIAFVRGALLNTGIYHAVREALGFPFRWNPAVLFLARFMTVFAGVIAVTKVSAGVDLSRMGGVPSRIVTQE